MDIYLLFLLVILILSVILHEVAHGYMAYFLGDHTAKLQGRLTLNPVKHADLFGSVIIPTFLLISNSPFMFGWAKPVPYNPYNLNKGGRFAEALVAFAGPAVNILIALFVSLLLRASLIDFNIAYMVIYMNVFLAILNLVPIPPLDGSKVWPVFLPSFLRISFENFSRQIEQTGPLALIFAILVLIFVFSSPLASLARAITEFML